MTDASKTTTDHDEIRRWVEDRGGVPATVAGTDRAGEAGVLRINFPGYGEDERLEEVSWGGVVRQVRGEQPRLRLPGHHERG